MAGLKGISFRVERAAGCFAYGLYVDGSWCGSKRVMECCLYYRFYNVDGAGSIPDCISLTPAQGGSIKASVLCGVMIRVRSSS